MQSYSVKEGYLTLDIDTNIESWKKVYREKGDLWKTMYPQGYLEFKGLKNLLKRARTGMNLLEVGIGTGEAALPFLKKGLRVEGFDISEEALDICKMKFSNASIEPSLVQLENSTLQEYRFPKGRYDIIIDYYTSQHVPRIEQDTFYRSVRTALVSKGLFLLGQYSKDYLEKQEKMTSKGDGVFEFADRFFCVASPEEMVERLNELDFIIDSIATYPVKGFYEILAVLQR